MKLSIIIPTGNRSILLRRALQMQLWQTFDGPREVLIADQGDRPFAFNDWALERVDGKCRAEQFERSGIAVRCIRAPVTLSVGFLRNFAIEHCDTTGPAAEHWIVHQDDDDFYAPTYLAELVAMYRDELAGEGLGGASQFYHYDFLLRRGWKTNLWTSDQPYGATFIYSRKVWERVGKFEDLRRGEDDAFFRGAESKGFRARAMKRPDLFCYMRHGRNISWRIDPIIDQGQTEDARAVLGDAVWFYDDLAELVAAPGAREAGPQWFLPSAQRAFSGKLPGER